MIDLTKAYDMDEVCILVPLPCGCIVEASLKHQDGLFECPWCEATFDMVAFGQWINGEAVPPISLSRSPRTMLRWQGHLAEVHGEKSGLPLVRLGQELVCVPQQDVEWVSN